MQRPDVVKLVVVIKELHLQQGTDVKPDIREPNCCFLIKSPITDFYLFLSFIKIWISHLTSWFKVAVVKTSPAEIKDKAISPEYLLTLPPLKKHKAKQREGEIPMCHTTRKSHTPHDCT